MTTDRVASEAEAWFARLRGPHGEADRDAFARWRDADPRHAAAYAQTERMWAIAAQARRDAPEPPKAVAWRPRTAIAFALAASLCVLLGAVLLGLRDPPGASVPAGPRQVATLADGSLIVPEAGARYAVAMSDTDRRITMAAGRARFVVACDRTRAFRVEAGDFVVIARGTVFDIDLTGALTRIDLADGAVDIARQRGGAPNRALRLLAGQSATMTGQVVERAERRPLAASRQPMAFTDAPLASVLALANVNGGTPILLGDRRLGARRVSGALDLADRPALARKLATALGLAVRTSPSGIVLAIP